MECRFISYRITSPFCPVFIYYRGICCYIIDTVSIIGFILRRRQYASSAEIWVQSNDFSSCYLYSAIPAVKILLSPPHFDTEFIPPFIRNLSVCFSIFHINRHLIFINHNFIQGIFCFYTPMYLSSISICFCAHRHSVYIKTAADPVAGNSICATSFDGLPNIFSAFFFCPHGCHSVSIRSGKSCMMIGRCYKTELFASF